MVSACYSKPGVGSNLSRGKLFISICYQSCAKLKDLLWVQYLNVNMEGFVFYGAAMV